MTHFGKFRRTKATACGSAITCSTTAATTAVTHRHGATSTSLHCYCLAKLMQKLKKHSKMLCVSRRRRDSIQCRYDPLSYSLNFDPTGSGTLPEDHDEEYYQFYAFSSRFVAPPKGNCPARLLTAASH